MPNHASTEQILALSRESTNVVSSIGTVINGDGDDKTKVASISTIVVAWALTGCNDQATQDIKDLKNSALMRGFGFGGIYASLLHLFWGVL